jgi:hypothetical protein
LFKEDVWIKYNIIVHIKKRTLEDLFSSFQPFPYNQSDVYKIEGSEYFMIAKEIMLNNK